MTKKFLTPILLPGDPTQALEAAPKQYVDSKASGPESDANANTYYGVNTPADLKGGSNAAFGQGALAANQGGSYNMAVGPGAMSQSANPQDSIGIGYASLMKSEGSGSIAIGSWALANSTTGPNVGIGKNALIALTGGTNNVGIGSASGGAMLGGTGNTAIGNQAAGGVIDGHYNVAIGNQALGTNVTNESFDVAIGYQADAYASSSAGKIVAIGPSAKAHSYSVAIGAETQARGYMSTAIGYGAIATLSNQIMLGGATERVYVNNDPVAAMEVATKRYVDALVIISTTDPIATNPNCELWFDPDA